MQPFFKIQILKLQNFLILKNSLGLYLFEPKEITKIYEDSCNMKFETLYLKGNRCHDDLIKRVTDIIDI